MFDGFTKYEHWTLKNLTDHTHQPQMWLKEILADIAILNKRGPYVGTYQLKPEFRNHRPTAVVGAAATGRPHHPNDSQDGFEDDPMEI